MCKLLSFVLILLAVTFYQTNAQIWRDGPCRTLPKVANFVVNRFVGRWFEQSRYDYQYQTGGECAQAQYTAIPNLPYSLNVNNTMLFPGNNTWHSRSAFVRFPNVAIGTMEILFNISLPEGSPPAALLQLHVIQTDYDSHAILWSCTPAPNNTNDVTRSLEYLWILTRDREPTTQINFAITQFTTLLFDPPSLRSTIQTSERCGAAQMYAGIFLAIFMATIAQLIK